MTIYFETARARAGNPNQYPLLKKEAVYFSVRGWEAFAKVMAAAQPQMTDLLSRLERPVSNYPRHPAYQIEGQPMSLVWTRDECRQLFVALAAASKSGTETAYDFWEFLALLCCGINEEGICAY
jgi:hypothetical protein